MGGGVGGMNPMAMLGGGGPGQQPVAPQLGIYRGGNLIGAPEPSMVPMAPAGGGGGGGFNPLSLLGGMGGMNPMQGGLNPMAMLGGGGAGGAMAGGLPALGPEGMQALLGWLKNPQGMTPPSVPDRGVIGGNMLGWLQNPQGMPPGTGTPLPGRAFGAGGPGTGELVGAPLRDREVGVTRVQAPPLQVAPMVPQRGGAGMTAPAAMSPERLARLREASLAAQVFPREYGNQ